MLLLLLLLRIIASAQRPLWVNLAALPQQHTPAGRRATATHFVLHSGTIRALPCGRSFLCGLRAFGSRARPVCGQARGQAGRCASRDSHRGWCRWEGEEGPGWAPTPVIAQFTLTTIRATCSRLGCGEEGGPATHLPAFRANRLPACLPAPRACRLAVVVVARSAGRQAGRLPCVRGAVPPVLPRVWPSAVVGG